MLRNCRKLFALGVLGIIGLCSVWGQFTLAEEFLVEENVSAVELKVLQIATGKNHSCALLTDYTVWCWGKNSSGLLGVGSSEDIVLSPAPVLISTNPKTKLTNVVEIGAGEGFTCARLRNGSVWCWGHNRFGNLGIGGELDQKFPTKLIDLADITQISVGLNTACALTANSDAKCWGKNNDGQVGDNSKTNASRPTYLLASRNSRLENIVQISVGVSHSCARMNNGSLRCWGLRNNARLGIGGENNGNQLIASETVTGISNAIQVSAGKKSTCAFLDNASVQCWGDGSLGQLGNNTTTKNAPPSVVQKLSQMKNVFSFRDSVCASLVDNTLMCWGTIDGTIYEVPALVRKFSATQIDVSFTDTPHGCLVLPNKKAKCWGDNTYGQLSNGSAKWVKPIDKLTLYKYDDDCVGLLTDKDESSASSSRALTCNLGPALKNESRSGFCSETSQDCRFEGKYADREKVCDISGGSCNYECSESGSWTRIENNCRKRGVRTPAPLPSPRNCVAETISASESDASLGRKHSKVACALSRGTYDTKQTGDCLVSSATRYEGEYGNRKRVFFSRVNGASCRYKCMDGNWRKKSNTCKQVKKSVPAPVVQCYAKRISKIGSTFSPSDRRRTCVLPNEYNAVNKKGVCNQHKPDCTFVGRGDNRKKKCEVPGGSCIYNCSRGNWRFEKNNCHTRIVTTPAPAPKKDCVGKTFPASESNWTGGDKPKKLKCTLSRARTNGIVNGTCSRVSKTCRYQGKFGKRVKICRVTNPSTNKCSYKCNTTNGRWTKSKNSCGSYEVAPVPAPQCAPKNIAGCSLRISDLNAAVKGKCGGKYTGTCNYTCKKRSNGTTYWNKNKACTLATAASCSAQNFKGTLAPKGDNILWAGKLRAECRMGRSNTAGNKTGTCAAGPNVTNGYSQKPGQTKGCVWGGPRGGRWFCFKQFKGSCSYRCNSNGTWTKTTNGCYPYHKGSW